MQPGDNIPRKRHITPDGELKKKRKESYNRALMEGPADTISTSHLSSHLNQSHNSFAVPQALNSNPNLIPVDKNIFCSFDQYYFPG